MGVKSLDYEDFCKVAEIMKVKGHLFPPPPPEGGVFSLPSLVPDPLFPFFVRKRGKNEGRFFFKNLRIRDYKREGRGALGPNTHT